MTMTEPSYKPTLDPKVIAEIQSAEGMPERFLEFWKKGIRLVGEEYFKIKDSLDTANSKWDLEPDKEMIEANLYTTSRGKATLLAVMYSFYESQQGQIYLEQLGRPNIVDLAVLDHEYLEVVTGLLLNYSGW